MSGDARNPETLHDVELVALAAAGGRREFGELVRRHASGVRALLRRMGAEPAAADDAAQDAFLQAFERITDYRGEGTFAAWVKKIAVRVHLKRVKADSRLSLRDEAPEPEAERPYTDRAGIMDLDEALKTLPEAERLCVSLCYGAGLSHAEAADSLNLPLGTVKSHVKRGVDRLRARLAAPSGDDRTGSAAHG